MIIITDTAADIMENEAEDMGIKMVQIDVHFELPYEPHNTPESIQKFYELLANSKELPSTSQPSPQDYLDLFEEAMDRKADVLVITLSSGLSGTFNSAMAAKQICGYENILILDSRQATIGQRVLVEKAVELRDQGMQYKEIYAYLSELREHIEVCGVLNTLTYLKKGGRVPASIATLGNILGIKPVVALLDSVVKSIGKARGSRAGKESLMRQYDRYVIDSEYPVFFGYTGTSDSAIAFQEEAISRIEQKKTRLVPVGSIIGTHLGPGAILLCFVSQTKISENFATESEDSGLDQSAC